MNTVGCTKVDGMRVFKWITIAALALVALLFATGSAKYFYAAMPYFLLLACPLMHLLHHRGHRPHQGGHKENGRTDVQDAAAPPA